MRFATMITTAALIGLSAQAAEPGGTSATEVPVCMGNGNLKAVPVARGLASQMFAGIAVTIDWRNPGACPAEAILIDLTDGTPREPPSRLAGLRATL